MTDGRALTNLSPPVTYHAFANILPYPFAAGDEFLGDDTIDRCSLSKDMSIKVPAPAV